MVENGIRYKSTVFNGAPCAVARAWLSVPSLTGGLKRDCRRRLMVGYGSARRVKPSLPSYLYGVFPVAVVVNTIPKLSPQFLWLNV